MGKFNEAMNKAGWGKSKKIGPGAKATAEKDLQVRNKIKVLNHRGAAETKRLNTSPCRSSPGGIP